MTYLLQYEQTPPDRPAERLALINRWLRSDWRPFFAELRERRPVFVAPGVTLITRFRDVREVLSQHNTFSVRPYAARMDATVGPFMLGRDSTTLNWRDKSIMRTMLPLEDLPKVRQLAGHVANEILAAQPPGKFDVVANLARQVPLRLCAEYFGFPGPDATTMLRWSKTTQWNFFKNLGNDPNVHAASVQSGQQMKAYLQALIGELRKGPPTDTVVGRLLKTNLPAGIGLDDERLVANIAGLLIGAVETTAQAIVQALDQVLRRPAVQANATTAAATNDDSTLDAIVWEALRFDPINPLLFRHVERDSTVAGGTERQSILPAGTLVFACTASAMHDDSELRHPDSFIPGRPQHHYLHFGYGHHECLGVHVGTVMIPEVIKQVLKRPGVSRLPGDGSAIDFGGGPFPERYEISINSR